MTNDKIELIALSTVTEGEGENIKNLFKNCRQKFIEEKDNIKLSQCISTKTGKPLKTQCIIFRKDEKDSIVVLGNYEELKERIYGKNIDIGFKIS